MKTDLFYCRRISRQALTPIDYSRAAVAAWPLGLILSVPSVVQAQFLFSTNNGQLTVVGYTGPGGVVAIPSNMYGLPVTAIGTNAFANSTTITNVSVPDSVTCIRPLAFSHCTGLTNATVGGGVTDTGPSAFDGCTGLLSVTIPDGTIAPDYQC